MKALLLAAAVLAGPAFAQDAPPPPPGPPMRAEIEAMTAKHFAEIDTDHDGVVTRAEFDAYEAARRAARQARGDGAPPPPPPPPSADGAPPPPPPPPGGMRGPGMGMGMGMAGPRWFERADANGDGKVTLAEAQAAALAMFDRMDANHDGRITPDEMPMRGPPPPRD